MNLDLFKKDEEDNKPMMSSKEVFVYTEEQLMARLKFFIGICLSLTLFGIVFVVLYSLIFVTQPLNAISPIDQKFFELIIPIATFLTGTLSGIMLAGNDKDAKMKALDMAAGVNKPTPPASPSGMVTPPRPMTPAPTLPTLGVPTQAPAIEDPAPVPVVPSMPKIAVPVIRKPGE